jgi:hypothetical protein
MQTCINPIIAIGGHPPFYELLCSNLAGIDLKHRVAAIQAVVGTGRQMGILVEGHGSAALRKSDLGAIKSLDDILKSNLDRIILLKVDTDGFDADVILSGINMIRASQPLLFWEGGKDYAVSFESMYEAIASVCISGSSTPNEAVRKPTRRIRSCAPAVTIGIAAAPPTSVMKSRLFIRSPRRRGRAVSPAR